MQLRRRLMMAGATLCVAFAAGHTVQNGLPFRHAAADFFLPEPEQIEQLAASAEPVLSLPEPAPLELAAPILPAPAVAPVAPVQAPLVVPEGSAAAQTATADCTPRLDLVAAPGAMLELSLLAPCRAGERVVIRHGGLAVTGHTTSTGAMIATLPAMSRDAEVSVMFAGGETVTNSLDLPQAAQHRRFAVQWMGNDAFQVHAFENGADYGTPGHVSAADPHAPGPGLAPDRGFLTLLGDDGVENPMLAEVYTFPAAGTAVDVVLETAVTRETCAREIMGETVTSEGGTVTISDLTIEMPGCEAKGEYLLLKKFAQDTKLAAAD